VRPSGGVPYYTVPPRIHASGATVPTVGGHPWGQVSAGVVWGVMGQRRRRRSVRPGVPAGCRVVGVGVRSCARTDVEVSRRAIGIGDAEPPTGRPVAGRGSPSSVTAGDRRPGPASSVVVTDDAA